MAMKITMRILTIILINSIMSVFVYIVFVLSLVGGV